MDSKIRTVAVALLVVLSTAAAVPLSTTAQTDDGLVGNLLDDEDDGTDWSERVRGVVSGVVNRVTAPSDDTNATTAADEFAATFNSNASEYQVYANNRTDASTSSDVLAIEFDVEGETATRYLVADVNDSDYVNSSVVASTDREVDHTCTLEDRAARNADDELDNFREEFVVEDRTVTERYLGRMAAEYSGTVSCSFSTKGVDK